MNIDFKEIEESNTGTGKQDRFELFARDFFEKKGFIIMENPSRGADGGIDLKISEIRKGASNQSTVINWLVSCKHYAHSGKSVSPSIEQDISDRVKSNNCDGFIGFYSSISSAGLQKKLEGMSKDFPHIIYDYERIENEIIGFDSWITIFQRYFPQSYKKWKDLEFYKEPVKLFEYYFTKEYELDGLLNSIFNSPENILKAIINTNNFEEFITYNSLHYFIEDIQSIVAENFNNNYNSFKSKLDKCVMDAYDYIASELFAEYLTKKYKISVNGKSKIRGWYGPKYGKGFYILYSNVLCVNEPKDEDLRDIYNDLKKILD